MWDTDYKSIGDKAKLFANNSKLEKGEKIVTGKETFKILLPDIRFLPILCSI